MTSMLKIAQRAALSAATLLAAFPSCVEQDRPHKLRALDVRNGVIGRLGVGSCGGSARRAAADLKTHLVFGSSVTQEDLGVRAVAAIRGNFRCWTGGDMIGTPRLGEPAWHRSRSTASWQ
jgi:hypothetical protein